MFFVWQNLECIFGTNLTNLCNREKRCVLQFLDEIVIAIDLKGIDTDGLYRVNGNLSDVQNYVFKLIKVFCCVLL